MKHLPRKIRIDQDALEDKLRQEFDAKIEKVRSTLNSELLE